MIFVLIAGSYTPFALLVLHGTLGTAILTEPGPFVAVAGAVFKLIWTEAPRWLMSATYVAIGWMALVAIPELVHGLGIVAVAAVGAGGILTAPARWSMPAGDRTRRRWCSAITSCSNPAGDPRRGAPVHGRGLLGSVGTDA